MKIFYNTMVNWPNWKEHTKSRRSGQFESGDIAKSVKRIVDEVNKFSRYASRTKALEISVWTNKTNKDGSFSGGYDNGQAPEVVVKFDLDGTDYVIPCDVFTYASQNLCAIAKTIEGLRANERYGVMTMKQMMAGVAELPRVSSAARKAWWEVFDIVRNSSKTHIEARYRELAKFRHPNAGGTDQEWHELQEAYEIAKQVGA